MAQLQFTNVYGLLNGVVGGGAPFVTGTYVITDGDNLLEANGQDTFVVTIILNSQTVTSQSLLYTGTNANGDVFAEIGGGSVMFSNTSYNFGDTPPAEVATDLTICFARGTRITTLTGQVAVERLEVGDPVITHNGVACVRWTGARKVGRTELRMKPELQPIRIAAGTLGNTRALTVSPEHRMLVTGWRAEVLHGTAEVLVPAKALVNDSTIRRMIPEDGVEYWHVLFDQHEVIEAEGCWSESLNPDAHALDGMDADARDEVLALFPELANGAGLPAARTLVGGAALSF